MFAGGGMRSLQSALFSQVQARRPREAGPLNEQHYGEPVSSSTSVAVSTTHQAADLGAQRIVTLRVFDGNIHRLGPLALGEAAFAIVGLYAAIFIRFAGSSATLAAFEASRGPFWPRALTIAGAFMVALAAPGPCPLRPPAPRRHPPPPRPRFPGVCGRLRSGGAVAGGALGLLFYAAPPLDVGRGVM